MGRLFLRSSWDEDATWLGYFDGELQVFAKDGLKIIRQQPASKPIRLGDAAVVMASGASPIQLDGMDVRAIYLLGLRPGAAYEIRGASGGATRETADSGGIVALTIQPETGRQLRIRELTGSRKRGDVTLP